MLFLKDFLQLDMLSTNRITLQHGRFSKWKVCTYCIDIKSVKLMLYCYIIQ